MFNKKNRGKMYVTKRNDSSTMVNAFNENTLKHMRSNMDVSYIHNAESLAFYVCFYVLKSEPNELRTALADLINNIFKQNPDITQRQKPFRIGLAVLKHRRMSAQEAAVRLSDIPLVESSRKTIPVNTRMPHKRYRMMKKTEDIRTIAASDPTSTDVFFDGIIELYHQMPPQFEQMSLYHFAGWYEKCQRPTSTRTGTLPRYQLSGGAWIKARSKAAVVRTPSFPVLSQDNFYSLLLLLLPHRDETELIPPYADSRSAFEAKSSLFAQDVHDTYFH